MRLVLIPSGNAAELSEIPEHVREKVKIHPVRTMEEVLPLVLIRPLPKPVRRRGGRSTPNHRKNGEKAPRPHASAAGRGTA
jgi:predicted ATP-dependent protease